MDKVHAIVNYLKYRYLRVNAHGIHSPFVFELYNQVFRKEMHFYAYEKVEDLRRRLLSDLRPLEVTDLGAGSYKGLKKVRTVGWIARTSAKEKKYGQLLFRLVNHFQPSLIIELGTSLGISTAYLAIARANSKVITIEGSPQIRRTALSVFKQLELENIESIEGNFDTELPAVLARHPQPGLVFFDGNHLRDATLRYFEQCLASATPQSIFVFDDIYWSEGMTEAWEQIKAHPQVTVTLDLFQMGIVFFRKEQAKEHFIIDY